MKIMKVMYFTIEGFDVPNANNHLAQTMIETFLENGIEVYLLQSFSNGPEPIVPDSIKDNPNFSYDIVSRKRAKKNNFLGRYFEGIQYAFNAKKKWKHHISTIDAVIVQSTYLSWLSIKMLKKCNRNIIFSIFDLFPDVVFDVGASRSKLIFKVLDRLQSICYKQSKKVIVITDDVKEKLVKKGVPNSKLGKIVNWFNEKQVAEVQRDNNAFIRKYSISEKKFYVQYAGNFGYTFNYRFVIEVAKLLSSFDDIEFHMIGSGTFEKEFKEEAACCNNIKFFPWQPLNIISDVYSSCSIGFIPLSKGVIGNSFPSKMPLIMACHRTFVVCANMESCFAKEVNDNAIGICVSDSSPSDCAQAILKLYKDNEMKKVYEDNALKYAHEEYGSKNNVDKFVKLLEGIRNE